MTTNNYNKNRKVLAHEARKCHISWPCRHCVKLWKNGSKRGVVWLPKKQRWTA